MQDCKLNSPKIFVLMDIDGTILENDKTCNLVVPDLKLKLFTLIVLSRLPSVCVLMATQRLCYVDPDTKFIREEQFKALDHYFNRNRTFLSRDLSCQMYNNIPDDCPVRKNLNDKKAFIQGIQKTFPLSDNGRVFYILVDDDLHQVNQFVNNDGEDDKTTLDSNQRLSIFAKPHRQSIWCYELLRLVFKVLEIDVLSQFEETPIDEFLGSDAQAYNLSADVVNVYFDQFKRYARAHKYLGPLLREPEQNPTDVKHADADFQNNSTIALFSQIESVVNYTMFDLNEDSLASYLECFKKYLEKYYVAHSKNMFRVPTKPEDVFYFAICAKKNFDAKQTTGTPQADPPLIRRP